MEEYPTNNNILQVIEMLIKLKLNMQAILNPNFHFHLSFLLSFFHITIKMQDRKINLLDDGSFHITVDCGPNKISDSPSNTIKCLILFLKVRELEFEWFVLSEYTSRFKFFREWMKLSW